MEEKRKFGIIDKCAYMLGDVGCNLVLTFANSYLLVFYTKVMGISAGIVGTLFMLARFVDAGTDVFVGRVTDTHVGKNGERYRHWMAYASVPLVICNILMYNFWLADAAQWIKVVWLTVTYLLFGSVFYTAVNIPYGAMSAVITEDPGQRSSLSTWRSAGSTIGGCILGIIIPLVVYTQDADGNDVASGPRFFIASIFLGIGALICLLLCYFGSVERIRISNKEETKKSDSTRAVLGCFKDRAIVTSIAFSVFLYASTTMFTTFNQYMFLDYFGNTSLSGLASLVMLVAMLLPALFVSPVSKRIGKKELSVIGLGISTVTYLLLYLSHTSSVMVYFVAVFFAFFGIGIVTMVGYALLNDCIDNHYLVSGDNVGGTVYGLNSFMRKMAGAITTGVGGWGLVLINYDELATVQTESVVKGVYNLGIGLPAICFIFSLIFMIFMPLTKKTVEENAEKMAALKQSKQQEEDN